MDEYTRKTKLWLDERFKKHDEHGIYFAHQPIYGFRKDHCDPGYIYQYISYYQIMKALSHMKFNSLLDVGGAEGYTAYIAKQIFGVKVRVSDLSEEACLRAREIFKLDSDPADIHELPYADDAFDVVLCTASLEHVADYRKAISELLRVASKAVVITVPHEHIGVIEKNMEQGIPHGHIHNFGLDSLNYLTSQGYDIIKKRISSRLLMFLDYRIEPYPGEAGGGLVRYPKFFVNTCFVPIWRKMYGKKLASFMVYLDNFLCYYYLILFTILKDKTCYSQRETHKISPSQIMSYTVPYHYLTK